MSVEVEATTTSGFSFANRCKSLPVVNSTYSLINDYYNRVKETNRLTKYTIGLAETTVKTSIGLANPVLDKFKGPIQALDTIACRQLDKLETAYPIIHEDTNTVVNQGKVLLTKSVQPAVDKIHTIEDKYAALKSYGSSKVSSISNVKEELKVKKIINKILDASQYVIETYIANDRVYIVDDKVLLDYYKGESSNLPNTIAANDPEIMDRVRGLSYTLYCGVQRRALKQVNSLMLSFDAYVDRLSRLVELLEKQKKHLKSQFNEKMEYSVKKIGHCKDYLALLAKQMKVQDGRSLDQVHVSYQDYQNFNLIFQQVFLIFRHLKSVVNCC